MSRRSDQGIVGGIVGVVGLAAAAGVAVYTGYQWLKEKQTMEPQLIPNSPPYPMPWREAAGLSRAELSPPRRAEPEKICSMCQKNISASDLITLDCSHPYHRICLHANYILHMADVNYKCPIRDCQHIVPEDRLTYFLNI